MIRYLIDRFYVSSKNQLKYYYYIAMYFLESEICFLPAEPFCRSNRMQQAFCISVIRSSVRNAVVKSIVETQKAATSKQEVESRVIEAADRLEKEDKLLLEA